MNRFDIKSLSAGSSWADEVANHIIEKYPEEEIYTVAAGISPSGPIHFGNFRDIMTSYAVQKALIEMGKKTRFVFSWDNYDRFRKVPINVPESFEEYIGRPLYNVPSLEGGGSYAEYFIKEFVESMNTMNLSLEYKNQYEIYASGAYDEEIKSALKKREEIAEVLLSFMSKKAIVEKGIDSKEYKEKYYPVSVYSRFTGKDNTKILSYDGGYQITYYCADTCEEDTIDFRRDRFVKLAWKVDWPMRWKFERVHFEPGGADHAAPCGSYDVASKIAKEIYNYEPPIFVEYGFVGIQGLGTKMSGSSGNAITPKELLEIYEPEVLKWLYLRKLPKQTFQLALDTEIYRQYDEYDREHNIKTMSFRQIVGLGQIVQWSLDKLDETSLALGTEYRKGRVQLARNWLEKYNSKDIISLRDTLNEEYIKDLSDVNRKRIVDLSKSLTNMKDFTIEEIELMVYDIPKKYINNEEELKKEQRAFFKDVYNLLISRDTGPRLGTFIWATNRDQLIKLLNI